MNMCLNVRKKRKNRHRILHLQIPDVRQKERIPVRVSNPCCGHSGGEFCFLKSEISVQKERRKAD